MFAFCDASYFEWKLLLPEPGYKVTYKLLPNLKMRRLNLLQWAPIRCLTYKKQKNKFQKLTNSEPDDNCSQLIPETELVILVH